MTAKESPEYTTYLWRVDRKDKEAAEQAAKARNESLNSFITSAVKERSSIKIEGISFGSSRDVSLYRSSPNAYNYTDGTHTYALTSNIALMAATEATAIGSVITNATVQYNAAIEKLAGIVQSEEREEE